MLSIRMYETHLKMYKLIQTHIICPFLQINILCFRFWSCAGCRWQTSSKKCSSAGAFQWHAIWEVIRFHSLSFLDNRNIFQMILEQSPVVENLDSFVYFIFIFFRTGWHFSLSWTNTYVATVNIVEAYIFVIVGIWRFLDTAWKRWLFSILFSIYKHYIVLVYREEFLGVVYLLPYVHLQSSLASINFW